MDLKELNEGFKQLFEKEVSPEFKDFLQAHRDAETSELQAKRKKNVDDAIYYNKRSQETDSPDWYEKEAQQHRDKVIDIDKKIANKRRNIDKIYKEIGDRGVDVQNLKIDTIPLANLNSAKLNKILKDAVNEDPSKKYYLIIPYYDEFQMYRIYTSEGKLYSTSLYRNQYINDMVVGAETLRAFMKDLNSSWGGTVYKSPNIFLAYGDDTQEIRNKRANDRNASLDRAPGYRGKDSSANDHYGDSNYDRTYGYTDRSGYYVNMQDLNKRLDQFKRDKGSFDKPIQDSIEKFDSLLNNLKDTFNDISADKLDALDSKNISKVISNLRSASRYINRAKEKADNDTIESIRHYLNNADNILNPKEEA